MDMRKAVRDILATGEMADGNLTPQYAVMIKTRYQRYLPEVWVTHLVCDSLQEVRTEQTLYEASQNLLPGHGTTVVEYHSQEWERLAR